MKITIISDLHGHLINIPESELLLICGDVGPDKYADNFFTERFPKWINSLPVKQVIMVPGNHDLYIERLNGLFGSLYKLMPKLNILIGGSISYYSDSGENVTIGGTPYCKKFGNWAFMPGDDKLDKLYQDIPEGVDILISHDAPQIADLGFIKEEGCRWYGKDAGNPILAQHIERIKPKFAFCGHIHSGNHNLETINGITYANVSICNESYKPVNQPLTIDFNVK